MLLSALGYPAIAIALCIVTVALAVRRRPRQAISVALALAIPVLLWAPINWAAEYVHLGLTVGLGLGEIPDTPKPDGNRFAVYDWSVGFAGSGNLFVIHDVTDEITLPLARHTHPVLSQDGFEHDCAGQVTHFIGHYYFCSI